MINAKYNFTSIFKQYKFEIIGVLLCLILGFLSGSFMDKEDLLWNQSLNQPYLNPPKWIFAPVWSILYIMIGVIFGRLFNENKKFFTIFVVQFILNLLWTPLFFYLHRIDLALYDLSLLLLILILMAVLFWNTNRLNFLLLLPYLLWTSFAFYLNFSLFLLN